MHEQDPQQEAGEWLSSLNLDQTQHVYLYGIGLGHYYRALQPWLRKDPSHQLIVIEDQLAAVDALLHEPCAASFLQDPQAHLYYLPSSRQWEPFLETLLFAHPSHHIEVTALRSYAKRRAKFIAKMRLKLLRASTHLHAVFAETLHYDKLFDNLLPNFKRIPHAFCANELKGKFEGVPAIICGAGPSLETSIETLKTLEHRALIIAGGSALSALSRHGVTPHLGVALDPNPEEYERLKPSTAFEIPLLYSNRLRSDVFALCNGPFGYLRSDTGGECESWLEKELKIESEPLGSDMGREAFSVTTLAISLAYALGCNPIILTGVDLAFTNMKRYASGVVDAPSISFHDIKRDKRSTERTVRRKNKAGKSVHTLIKWVMEAESITRYVKAHRDRSFINASEESILASLPYLPLEHIAASHCSASHDLRARLHAEIAQHSFSSIKASQIESALSELKGSVERCLKISQEMLQELRAQDLATDTETGKMVILEFDFQEELAFRCFLPHFGAVLERIAPPSPHRLDRTIYKWEQTRQFLISLNSSINS